MLNEIEIMLPVKLTVDDVVDMIHDNITHEEVAEFVKKVDLRYADVGVTEQLINVLMESITTEFKFNKMEAEWQDKCDEVADLLSKLDPQ